MCRWKKSTLNDADRLVNNNIRTCRGVNCDFVIKTIHALTLLWVAHAVNLSEHHVNQTKSGLSGHKMQTEILTALKGFFQHLPIWPNLNDCNINISILKLMKNTSFRFKSAQDHFRDCLLVIYYVRGECCACFVHKFDSPNRHRVCVLDWPACSPDLSPIESVWRIMKRRIRQRWPRPVEQLKSCIHQEKAKIPLCGLQTMQQLIQYMPTIEPSSKSLVLLWIQILHLIYIFKTSLGLLFMTWGTFLQFRKYCPCMMQKKASPCFCYFTIGLLQCSFVWMCKFKYAS